MRNDEYEEREHNYADNCNKDNRQLNSYKQAEKV